MDSLMSLIEKVPEEELKSFIPSEPLFYRPPKRYNMFFEPEIERIHSEISIDEGKLVSTHHIYMKPMSGKSDESTEYISVPLLKNELFDPF